MAIVTGGSIWVKSFLASLVIFLQDPIPLYCDNQAALHVAKNPVFHEQTKHIEIDCRFIRECLISGELMPKYLPSKYQLADIFTKALGKQ